RAHDRAGWASASAATSAMAAFTSARSSNARICASSEADALVKSPEVALGVNRQLMTAQTPGFSASVVPYERTSAADTCQCVGVGSSYVPGIPLDPSPPLSVLKPATSRTPSERAAATCVDTQE